MLPKGMLKTRRSITIKRTTKGFYGLLIIWVLSLTVLAGCGAGSTTPGTTSDTSAPTNTTASDFINSGASSTSSTTVTLTISATDNVGVTGYYASEISTTPSASATGWTSVASTTSYSATVAFTLSGGSLGDNTKTVYVWFKDSAGNISTVASDSITLTISDSTAPSNPTISINNGDTSTTSISITLTLSAADNTGITWYCANESSATPSANDTCWTSVTSATSYSAIVNFTLSGGSVGDNTKTVYVWFRDTAGNISTVASDSITLTISDSTAPSSPSVSINSGASSTTSISVTLTLSAADNVGVTGYCAKESSATPSANDTCWTTVTSTTSYSATVSFTLSGGSVGDNTKTVYVWFRDSAGNVSSSASDSIILTVSDTTTPSSPSVSINSGDDSTTTTSATLTLSATDDVGVTGYYASETSTTPSASASGWTTVTSATSYSGSVSFTLSSSSGTKTVYVWFRDAAGNVSAQASDSITLTISTDAWVYTTLDSAGDVGRYTSLSLDSTNKAHISYYDATNQDLKYATNASGDWVYSTLDSAGDVGWATSIALDSNNKMHISYYYASYVDDLKYATNASGDWVYTTLDSAGNVGLWTSIAIDSNNKVHIGYHDNTNGALKYATNASGSWVLSTLDSTGGVEYPGQISLALDSSNKAHISYWDNTTDNLKYATNASGVWVYTTIDSSGNGGMGWSSLALDSNNKAHIGYWDYTNTALKYATNASGSWATTTLDSAGNVGASPAIAIDSNNKVHISYLDFTNYDLKYATDVSGVWVYSIIDAETNIGYFTSLALDSNNKAHISYWDGNNTDLKYATKQSEAGDPPIVSTGSAISITHNSATLNGTVNPNGSATTTKFQYGPTESYGTDTASTDVGSGSAAVAHTANLSSLTPFTTYNYRISATNTVGTTDGNNGTFNTPISPPSTSQLLIDAGYTPDVAASADGTKVYAVYEGDIGTSGGTGIVFQKSTNGGETFGNKVNISPGTNGDSGQYPSIAIDSTGGIHIAYIRSTDYHIYYSKSSDEGATFSTPVKISDAVTDSNRWPHIDVTSSNVYVVWNGDDDRIYIDKSPLTSVSFGTDKMVNDPSTGYHYGPSIATGSDDAIYVVWHGRYSGTTNQINLAKSTDNAATFSTSIRVDDDTSGSGTIRPRISVSGNNVYVLWEDYRDIYADIRLRVSTDAGATFPAASIKVNDDTAVDREQIFADIKNDAKGTTYFIWRDNRNTDTTPDIYYAYAPTDNTQMTISANSKVNSDAGKADYGYRRPALTIGGGKIFTIWQGQDSDDTTWKIYFSR